MFCKQCGNQILDSAVVCVKCGVATDIFEKIEKKKVRDLRIADTSLRTIVAGYFLAVTMPLIGGIVGVYLLTKGMPGHGIAILILAVFSFLLWMSLFLAAAA